MINVNCIVCITRYLIWRCDYGWCHGGWGARINGVMFAYMIANLTGRTFKLEHLTPKCDLTDYMVPNLVNWYLPASFHRVPWPDVHEVDMQNRKDDMKFAKMFGKVNFYADNQKAFFTPQSKYIYFYLNFFPEKVIAENVKSWNQFSWMKDLLPGDMQSAIFKRLFKLSPDTARKLKTMLPRDDHQLVCAHVKMDRDPRKGEIELKKIPPSESLENVWRVISNHSQTQSSLVFIASDSSRVHTEAKQQEFAHLLISMKEPIVDLEKLKLMMNLKGSAKEDACGGLERIILEQHMLMNCDIIVVSHDEMSHLAAYIRGSDQGLYCHWSTGDVTPCTRADFTRWNG